MHCVGEGGASPAEVERLVDRLAREKGIVDPTNTPIAGMVATGVRHRAAEAFPWLAHGGCVRALLCRGCPSLAIMHPLLATTRYQGLRVSSLFFFLCRFLRTDNAKIVRQS